jgi:hypothetical protein
MLTNWENFWLAYTVIGIGLANILAPYNAKKVKLWYWAFFALTGGPFIWGLGLFFGVGYLLLKIAERGTR